MDYQCLLSVGMCRDRRGILCSIASLSSVLATAIHLMTLRRLTLSPGSAVLAATHNTIGDMVAPQCYNAKVLPPWPPALL